MNRKRILRYIRNLIIFFFASTILSVVALRFIPVYITPLMVIRSVEQLVKGEKVVMKHKWVPKEKISRHLPMAVIASEDNRFASHNGFDFKEISKAIEENKKRKKARGASTISQQTAKNVFLWPSSSWVRKGFEVYFTVLIELIWDKERIMEVYLNSIEMGMVYMEQKPWRKLTFTPRPLNSLANNVHLLQPVCRIQENTIPENPALTCTSVSGKSCI